MSTPACGDPAAIAGAGAPGAPASRPMTMVSNVRLSDLLWKFCITVGLSMVTCSPFFTAALLTAAQVSPLAVLRRM